MNCVVFGLDSWNFNFWVVNLLGKFVATISSKWQVRAHASSEEKVKVSL